MIVPILARGRVPAEILSVPGRQTRLKGAILAAHLSFLEATVGAAGLRMLEAGLPAVEGAGEWVPFALVVETDKAIARIVSPGNDEKAYVAMGRHSARRLLGGEQARGATIQHHFWTGMLQHAARADFGTCTYEPLEAQALRMEYRDYPVMSRVFCTSAYGFLEGSVEVLGGRDPIVEETACQCYGDASCTFRVSWER